jgi:hypothetical protein
VRMPLLSSGSLEVVMMDLRTLKLEMSRSEDAKLRQHIETERTEVLADCAANSNPLTLPSKGEAKERVDHTVTPEMLG